MTGRVAGIFLKPRVPGEFGLPKRPVAAGEVLFGGIRGDFNNYRQEELHGDPDSAVLLLTEELLASLRSDGWPVAPGDLGENLLLRGIDYARLAPAAPVAVGEAVRLTTTRACDPCHRLGSLPYVGREREADFLRSTLHRRGWYARVVAEGPVRVGDPVVLG